MSEKEGFLFEKFYQNLRRKKITFKSVAVFVSSMMESIDFFFGILTRLNLAFRFMEGVELKDRNSIFSLLVE